MKRKNSNAESQPAKKARLEASTLVKLDEQDQPEQWKLQMTAAMQQAKTTWLIIAILAKIANYLARR